MNTYWIKKNYIDEFTEVEKEKGKLSYHNALEVSCSWCGEVVSKLETKTITKEKAFCIECID